MSSRSSNRLLQISLFLLLPVLPAADTPKEAVTKVRQGLQHYRGSQFAEAETAFSEAAELAPENATITFDKACAALAGGDADQARGLFQKASLAKDAQLSVKAHYNLGCLEADQAREKLGEDPAAAEGEARTESISLLLAAVGHYRDVLRFRPDHQDARHNLELIRLFIKHIQSQWAERDKQKARDEKDLLQFLKMIEDRETTLRTAAKMLSDEPDSASQRKAVRDTADSQTELHEEIEPLKQKVSEQIQASRPQPGSPAAGQVSVPNDDELQKVEQLLHQLADEAGKGMLSAARSMTETSLDTAVAAQTESLNQLNQLYMAVAPYQNILQRSVEQQQSLVPETTEDLESAESIDDAEEDATKDDVVDSTDTKSTPNEVDYQQSRETQSRISDWSRMLSLKAESELPQVKQQLESLPPPTASPENASVEDDAPDDSKVKVRIPSSDPESEDESEADKAPELSEEEQAAKAQQEQMEQQRKQLQGLVESMELAIKLGPDAEEHSQTAVQALTAEDQATAEPEQQETLRLLKEIAEPLSKDQENQNDQQQDQQNQDDQQQDEDQQQEGDQQQQDKSQENKPESQDEQQQPESEEREQKESKKQQAESVLRQAHDREKQRRDLEKQMREILMRGFKVDKDW